VTSTPLVDWSLLGHVILVSLLAGVGIVAVFSIGLVGLSFARNTQMRRGIRTLSVGLSVVMTGVLIAVLWWGFVHITTKS